MKYYYVYIHICLVTAKAYIGWAVNPKRRWIEHCAAKDNKPFYNAIRKYGKECFDSQIIFRTISIKEVQQKEIEFIKQFNTQVPNGYNIASGGGGGASGCKHTEEWKQNKSKSFQGNKYAQGGKGSKGKHWKFSEETKEKMRKSHIGKKPNLGHKHTKESKSKIRKSMRGKNLKNGEHTKEAQIKQLKIKIKKLEKEIEET